LPDERYAVAENPVPYMRKFWEEEKETERLLKE